jgi:hypothetical protein
MPQRILLIMDDSSYVASPFDAYQLSRQFFDEYFGFIKNWIESLHNNKISPIDWRIWLPKAFWLNWSDPQTWQKLMLDPTIWLSVAFYSQEERERALRIVHIAGDFIGGDKAIGNIVKGNTAGGDIIGANISEGNIFGREIPRYTQRIARYQEKTIQTVKDIASDVIESQKQVVDSFQSQGGNHVIDQDIKRGDLSYIYRYSHIKFPSKVKVNDIKKLQVTIKVNPQSQNSSPMKIRIDKNEDEVEILVRMFVDNNFFMVIGQDTHILKIPIKENDSNTVSFYLEALSEGNSEIKLEFLQLNNILEEVGIPCIISQNEEGSTIQEIKSKPLEMKTTERFPSPDIIVQIMEDLSKEEHTYRFYLKMKEETTLRELGFKKFTKKDLEILQSMLNDIETDGQIGYEVTSRLETKGHKIYNNFVPSEFKEAYWEIRNQIESILIITADPKVPWELIKPQHKNFDGIIDKEDDFFCEKFSISRLLIMKGKSEEIPANETVKKLCLVIPPNPNLKNVDNLRKLMKDKSNKSKITIVNGSQKSQLMYQLKKGDFDLLFISTHGKYNKESSQYSYIELEDGGIFRPDDIDDDISLRKTKPIVIMNTCKSAVQDYGISTVEGWVNAFIKAGASFFIGTSWNVSEDSVYSFTEYLFEELSNENSNGKKITIGEAVRNARIKSRSEGDPSWLAYQLYGHPNGIIRLI